MEEPRLVVQCCGISKIERAGRRYASMAALSSVSRRISRLMKWVLPTYLLVLIEAACYPCRELTKIVKVVPRQARKVVSRMGDTPDHCVLPRYFLIKKFRTYWTSPAPDTV